MAPRTRALMSASPGRLPSEQPAQGVFIKFVEERYRIYERRHLQNLPPPWTTDHTLATYKFTNVYREHDRVTRWVHQNWLLPHKEHPDVWFAMLVARHINWPDSLGQLTYPEPWRPKKFVSEMQKLERAGEQLFSGAYMINQSIPGGKGLSKYAYLAEFIFSPAWENRVYLRPRPGEDTLAAFCDRLSALKGLGTFMAGQVVADVKWATLRDAEDWITFAVPGPGSKRGLNIVCGHDPEAPWRTEEWYEQLVALMLATNKALTKMLPIPLDAQNVQNCLCEFYKYSRGYSRSKFNPRTQ